MRSLGVVYCTWQCGVSMEETLLEQLSSSLGERASMLLMFNDIWLIVTYTITMQTSVTASSSSLGHVNSGAMLMVHPVTIRY